SSAWPAPNGCPVGATSARWSPRSRGGDDPLDHAHRRRQGQRPDAGRFAEVAWAAMQERPQAHGLLGSEDQAGAVGNAVNDQTQALLAGSETPQAAAATIDAAAASGS